jgi:signal transduction histidine kinase
MNTQFGHRNGQRRVFAKGTGQHERMPSPDDEINNEDELAQIVHDLKNPLSTIALEVDLMAARAESCERYDMTQAIGRIRRNVSYLDRLIYDLLDVFTLAKGRFALQRARCDLDRLLSVVIDRVVPSTERHRVSLDARESTVAMVDELRIERVVANLLDNALKYTPSSSGIVVRLTKEERDAQVSICDAGPGLTPAEIEVIFQPYRRATGSAVRPGSGLGLYVSKQIVEAHGGQIGVESVRGLGARFFFDLPLA